MSHKVFSDMFVFSRKQNTTKQHLCSHLHVSYFVIAFLYYEKYVNEYDEDLEKDKGMH